jgi:hypothetical protein
MPICTEARTKLAVAIAKRRRWLDDLVSGAALDIDSIAASEALSERSARMILSLAFLAPDIVKAAINGALPRGFGVSRLTDLPAGWDEQRQRPCHVVESSWRKACASESFKPPRPPRATRSSPRCEACDAFEPR